MRNGGREDLGLWNPPKQRGRGDPFRRICKHHKFSKVVARFYGPHFFDGPGNILKFIPMAEVFMTRMSRSKLSRATEIPSGTW